MSRYERIPAAGKEGDTPIAVSSTYSSSSDDPVIQRQQQQQPQEPCQQNTEFLRQNSLYQADFSTAIKARALSHATEAESFPGASSSLLLSLSKDQFTQHTSSYLSPLSVNRLSTINTQHPLYQSHSQQHSEWHLSQHSPQLKDPLLALSPSLSPLTTLTSGLKARLFERNRQMSSLYKRIHTKIRTRRSRSSYHTGQRQHSSYVQPLRWIWCLTLFLGEHASFWVMVHRCSWPENSTWDRSNRSSLQDRYHIAIIADPQLTDWYSYKQSGMVLRWVEFYTDLYMKRSFHRLHTRLEPDAVLFLGDLMDGGRETFKPKGGDQEFVKNRDRFYERVFETGKSAWNKVPMVMDQEYPWRGEKKSGVNEEETKLEHIKDEERGYSSNDEDEDDTDSLWNQDWDTQEHSIDDSKAVQDQKDTPEPPLNVTTTTPPLIAKIDPDPRSISGHFRQRHAVPLDASERRRIRGAGKSMRLYVAGNHDVGFGDTLIRRAMRRYKREFGSVNYEMDVGNHTLVVLDTLALSSNLSAIREESQEFLTRMGKGDPLFPRILFTHVPLFRRETTPCGPRRQSQQLILDQNGDQYQNLVNSTLTRQILRQIQPDLIFSGDDHDWCAMAHSLDGRLTPEVTLPTFSFAQGVQQPGFGMLSLYNPWRIHRNVEIMAPGQENARMMAAVSDTNTFVYESCMLPKQILIYMGYLGLLMGTLVWIMSFRFQWTKQGGSEASMGSRYIEGCKDRRSDSFLIRWQSISSSTTSSSPTFSSLTKSSRSNSMPHPLEGYGDEALAPLTDHPMTMSHYAEKEGEPSISSSASSLGASSSSSSTASSTCPSTLSDSPLIPACLLQRPLSSMSPLAGFKFGSSFGTRGTARVWRMRLAWATHWAWPIRTRFFWYWVLRDLFNVFRVAIPFYVVLVLVSILF